MVKRSFVVLAAATWAVVATAAAPLAPLAAQDADMFEARCAGGDMTACYVRGLMFETGAGEDVDTRAALEYYLMGCEGGSPTGCISIGLMHQYGRGVPRSPELAAEQYRIACAQGSALGCDLQRALESEGPITAPRPFATSGWAGDANSGEALPGVLVDVPRLGMQALSDDEGRISLGPVPEGLYEVRAEAVGYEPVSGVLNVPMYAEMALLLHAWNTGSDRRPGLVGGVVMDRRQDPVQGVTVELVGTEERPVQSGYEGRFTFPQVQPGLVRVRITVPGHEPIETMVIVQRGRAAVIEVIVGPDSVELERPPL